MKYIETYEKNINIYKIDDFVVINGEIAQIIHKYNGKGYSIGWYKIKYLEKSLIEGKKKDIVFWTQFERKLKPYEVDAIKYNL